jgi:hypothetical protein
MFVVLLRCSLRRTGTHWLNMSIAIRPVIVVVDERQSHHQGEHLMAKTATCGCVQVGQEPKIRSFFTQTEGVFKRSMCDSGPGLAGIFTDANSDNICHYFSMDIDLTGFSEIQKEALLDLLVLAMYADGKLSSVEDKLLQQVLESIGYTDELDRQREHDAAVTRMRPFVQTIEKARGQTILLAGAFTIPSQQKRVYAIVQQIMTVDLDISSWESTLLSELRRTFKI